MSSSRRTTKSKPSASLLSKQERIANHVASSYFFASEVHTSALRRALLSRKRLLLWWRTLAWCCSGIRVFCLVCMCIGVPFGQLGVLDFYFHRPMKIDEHGEEYILEETDAVRYLMTHTCYMWTILAVLCLACEAYLCYTFIEQNPQKIAAAYSASFAVGTLVLLAGILLAPISKNSEFFVRYFVGRGIDDGGVAEDTLKTWHKRYKCCGLNDYNDWINPVFYEYVVMQNASVSSVQYSTWFQKYTSACFAPYYCFPNKDCPYSEIPIDEYTNVMLYLHAGYTAPSEYTAEIEDQQAEAYGKGCLEDLTSAFDRYLQILTAFLWIFALMKCIMTYMIIVILLYHDSLGMLNPKANWIRSSEKNRSVRFFMWLDGMDVKAPEPLTEFSLVEYVKNVNVDSRISSGESDAENREPRYY